MGLLLTACASAHSDKFNFEETVRFINSEDGSSLETVLALNAAKADYDAERYDESFEKYQIIALQNPDNFDARIGWGNSAIALNLFEKSYEIFLDETGLDNASETQKNDRVAGLVLSEIATKRAGDEEVRLNDALEYNLDDARLWNALGQFHDKQESWVLAQRNYLKAFQADATSHSSVVNNIGMSYLKQGHYSFALEKFEQAIDIRSDRNLYDNNRRLTLALMEEYDQALEDVPNNRAAEIFNDAGYIALTQDKLAIAETLLERSIELSQSFNPEAHKNLEILKAAQVSGSIQDAYKVAGTSQATAETETKDEDWGELLP